MNIDILFMFIPLKRFKMGFSDSIVQSYLHEPFKNLPLFFSAQS